MSKLYYLDSSIFISYLINEKGYVFKSESLKFLVASKLTEVEVFRFIDREINASKIDRDYLLEVMQIAKNLFELIYVIPLSEEIMENAKGSFAFSIKTLDALHASSVKWLAQNTDEEVVFCSLDEKLDQVVKRLGIDTQDFL